MPPTIVIDSLLEAVNPTVWLLGFLHARIPPENDHVLTSQDGVGAAEGNFTGEPRAMSWSGAVESVAQSILSQRFGSSLRSQLASGIQKMQPGISASIRLSRPAFMPKIAPHELMPLPETRFESESFWPTPTHARISQTCSAKLRPMRRMHASAPATPRTATAQFGARLGSNFALQRIFPRIKIDWLAHACTHGRKRRPAGHRRVRPSVRPSVRPQSGLPVALVCATIMPHRRWSFSNARLESCSLPHSSIDSLIVSFVSECRAGVLAYLPA